MILKFPERESLKFCGQCSDSLEDEGEEWHGYCRCCAQTVLEAFIGTLLADFNDAERKLLNDCFDGVGLDEPEKARLPE